MGLLISIIEKNEELKNSEISMEEAIKLAQIEKQKDAERHEAYVAAKIKKVEAQLKEQGIEYDPAQLWGKYIDLRGNV